MKIRRLLLVGWCLFVALVALIGLPHAEATAKAGDKPSVKSGPVCRAAVLVYHRIGYLRAKPTKAERYVTNSPQAFRRQMEFLRDDQFRVVSYSDLVDCLSGGATLPEKAIVITFDDGLKSQFTVARPVLMEMGFTATFFVVTRFVGGGSSLMTWDDLRELESDGMTVAAHTVSHPWLTRLSDKRLADELVGSRQKLEAELGHPVYIMAYPFGAYDARVEAAVKAAGYVSARSIRQGTDHQASQLTAIRIVGVTDSLDHFRRVVTPPKP